MLNTNTSVLQIPAYIIGLLFGFFFEVEGVTKYSEIKNNNEKIKSHVLIRDKAVTNT